MGFFKPDSGGWRLATKTVTFTGGAGAGAVGTVSLFTVTGDVQITGFAAKCTTNLVDAGGGTPAGLDFGVTGNTGLIGPSIDPADGWDAGEWFDNDTAGQTAGGIEPGVAIYNISANIIATVAFEAINSGVIVVYVWWRPLSAGATLVAA